MKTEKTLSEKAVDKLRRLINQFFKTLHEDNKTSIYRVLNNNEMIQWILFVEEKTKRKSVINNYIKSNYNSESLNRYIIEFINNQLTLEKIWKKHKEEFNLYIYQTFEKYYNISLDRLEIMKDVILNPKFQSLNKKYNYFLSREINTTDWKGKFSSDFLLQKSIYALRKQLTNSKEYITQTWKSGLHLEEKRVAVWTLTDKKPKIVSYGNTSLITHASSILRIIKVMHNHKDGGDWSTEDYKIAQKHIIAVLKIFRKEKDIEKDDLI